MRKLFSLILVTLLAVTAIVPHAEAMEGFGNKDLNIGFVYISPLEEIGWSYSHELARLALQEEENVNTYRAGPVAAGADADAVLLDMARKGYDIIFATSVNYEESTLKIAQGFPHTIFMNAAGYHTAKNVGNYFGRIYQSRYLSGIVAGRMTTTNIIGYVAAFPIPEVVRGINAFTLGVKSVNPEAKVHVIWTKTWYDPAVEKVDTKELIAMGADVISQHQDSVAPQEAAAEAGVFSIGYNMDMSAYAPNAHLTAVVWDWERYYKSVVRHVRTGTWAPSSDWPNLESGVVGLSAYGDMVPQRVRDEVEDARRDMVTGINPVFEGPIEDQDGALRVADGIVMTDAELLDMMWFVKGVVGSVVESVE